MAGKFEISKLKDREYHFHLRAANGKIILTSQRYKDHSSVKGGIESVKKNAPLDKRYERKESHNGEHMFNLRAGNHQVIGTSQLYESVQAREEGIEAVKQNAPESVIQEESKP